SPIQAELSSRNPLAAPAAFPPGYITGNLGILSFRQFLAL
ncbi:hypothetical protein GWI33_009476, partial [Rhynchophorus ferrugineus]